MKWMNPKALLATVVLQVMTGVLLLSPMALLVPWAQAFRLPVEQVQPGAMALLLGVLTAVVYDALYAWLLMRLQLATLRDSLMLSVAIWAGVILVADFGHLLFAQIGWVGIAINAFVRLVNGLWAGWILYRWRPR